MMTREEYIQMKMTLHRELSMDMHAMHDTLIPEFDRSIYDAMSDEEINVKIHEYEESLMRESERIHSVRNDNSSDNGSWGDIRIGDWVYHRAEMGEESSSGWRHDPPHGMGW